MSKNTAEDEKPVRPLNSYFAFRAKRMNELAPDEKNRSNKIKAEWDALSDEEKKKMENEFLK
jgi:hypothetical protein